MSTARVRVECSSCRPELLLNSAQLARRGAAEAGGEAEAEARATRCAERRRAAGGRAGRSRAVSHPQVIEGAARAARVCLSAAPQASRIASHRITSTSIVRSARLTLPTRPSRVEFAEDRRAQDRPHSLHFTRAARAPSRPDASHRKATHRIASEKGCAGAARATRSIRFINVRCKQYKCVARRRSSVLLHVPRQ